MEQLVENGKGAFGKRVINEEEFFVLLTRLKSALPEDLKKAERLARDTDRVVSSAQGEAQRVLSEAQSEAQRLVGDARSQADRAVQDSRQRSERIIDEARREAERIMADAQQHAEQLVAENSITQRAQQLAETTQQTAVREADEIRMQADDYALEVLERVENVLHRLTSGVQAGKDQMRQINQPPPPAP